MKKFAVFSVLFIFLIAVVWGETYTWVGGSGNNWNDEDNWINFTSGSTGDGFPGEAPGDEAIINSNAVITITIPLTNDLASLTINTGASLTLTGTLTVDSNFTHNGTLLTATSLSVTGTSTIGGNVTTTGAQTYNGAVTLSGTGTRTLQGTTVTLGAITGGGNSLTIHGNAVLNGGSNIGALTINNNTTDALTNTTIINAAISAVSVTIGRTNATGIITINANITTSVNTGNAQYYYGPVVLGANVNFTGASGSTIRFNNTVTGPGLTVTDAITRVVVSATTTGNQEYRGPFTFGSGTNANSTLSATGTGSTITFGGIVASNTTSTTARSLSVSSENVIFNGQVGNITGNGRVSVLSVSGTTTIIENIYTTGNQTYSGPVTLGGTGTRNLTASGGSVTVTGIVTGTNGITVNTLQGITMDAANTLSGNVTLNNTQTGTLAGNILFRNISASLNLTAANNRANGTITVNQTGALSVTSASTPATGSVTLTATGAITQTGAITTTGTLNINSGGAITLNAANTIATLHVTAAGGVVQFANNATLTVTEVSGVGNNNVTITTNTGAVRNITQTGAITTTGTLTINSSGNITQTGTGAITTASALTVNSSGAITLTNTANNVSTLHITGAGGAVQFTNNAALAVTGVSGVGNNNVMLTAAGAGNSININGTINCLTLSLKAVDGTVNIASTITVTGGDNTAHDENAGVFITADVLTGGGIINLNGNIGWVCAFIKDNSSRFSGSVNGGEGIHYHIDNMHIVYSSYNSRTVLQTNHPTIATHPSLGGNNYFYYWTYDHLSNNIFTTGSGNIYIIDVDDGNPSNPALTRDVSFTTESGGHIEIWGEYTTETTGELTLNPGNDGVVLIGANIDLVGGFNTNGHLRISGTNSINAANITLHGGIEGTASFTNTLSLEASSISSIEGNVGQSVPLNDLTVKGALALKNSTLRASSFVFDNTVTIDGTVALNGPVNLANNVTISAPSGGTAAFTQINEGSGPYLLTFSGGANSPLIINQVNAGGVSINGSVTIAANSYVQTASGAAVTQAASKELTLGTSAVLDTSAGTWHMGTAGTLNDFAGINGALNLGENSKLTANALHLTGSPFTITNSVWATIGAKGNAEITDDVTFSGDYPQLIIEMDGNGTQTLTTEIHLGSLHVGEHSHTRIETGGPLAISDPSTIIILGMVKISALSAPAGLDAGNYNIVMYAGLTGNRNLTNYTHNGSDTIRYARWENVNASIVQPPYSSPPDVNSFVFRQNPGGRVSFQREPGSTDPVFFEIAGNTMWREFECSVPGAVVQFSRHPDYHTVLEDFSIGNKSSTAADHSDYVTITRLTDNAYINFPYIYVSSMGPPPMTSAGANVGDLGSHALPVYYPPLDLKNAAPQEKEKYWNINFVTVSGPSQKPLDNFRYVRIFFSHAYNQRIPIETSSMHLDAVPYYRPSTGDGHFNFDWIELRKILYSFTEDSSGDGRLDRIRVQTNVRLNGDFSAFEVDVEGYKIDPSKGTNGFMMVSDLTGYNDDEDSFYIYLQQVPYVDSGSTPLWSVTRNESLKDLLTESSSVGDPVIDVDMRPFDTIPVRIAYTLTLPGHPQTYIRMSEPALSLPGGNISDAQAVERSESYIFTWKYFPYDSPPVTFTMPVISANLGYLLNMPSSFDIEALSRLKNIFGDTTSSETDGYFKMDNIIDQGQRAMDWHDPSVDPAFYIYYQPPKYPLNWAYTEYAKVYGNGHLTGNGFLSPDFSDDDTMAIKADGSSVPLSDVFLPPNKMLSVEMMTLIAQGEGYKVTPQNFASYSNPSANDTVIRRITDVLVSLAPASGDSENYFAWPVWARYQNNANPDNASLSGDFWSQRNTDNGVIWTFDGSAFLEARGLELQARMNGALTGNLELFWTTDIPTEYRIPQEDPVRGRSTGGLWLPYPVDLHNRLLYYFAPLYGGSAVNQTSASAAGNSPLYNFSLNGENSSGKKMEFVFRINGGASSDLFIARLDIPRTGAIPENWYYLVRPFGFDIQDIRLQRGGVTVLNNVINSDARENAFIRYHLVRPGRVTVQVYTLDGTLVKSLRRNEYREAGEWTDAWDGTNNSGRAVARGMYFVRVVAPDIDEIRKIMVVR